MLYWSFKGIAGLGLTNHLINLPQTWWICHNLQKITATVFFYVGAVAGDRTSISAVTTILL